jgi:hypothetical protein
MGMAVLLRLTGLCRIAAEGLVAGYAGHLALSPIPQWKLFALPVSAASLEQAISC